MTSSDSIYQSDDQEHCDRRGCKREPDTRIVTEAPQVCDHDYTEWMVCRDHAETAAEEWLGVSNVLEAHQLQQPGDPSKDRIDRATAEKDRELLEQDYATPCHNCGGVVFEWWDSDTCRDCEDTNDQTSTKQTTLIPDGGEERVRCRDYAHDVSKGGDYDGE